MNPDPSIRKTWRGAAEGGAAPSAGRSATAAPATSARMSSIGTSCRLADLARRRALAAPLLARGVRRRHRDSGFARDPAGPRHGAVHKAARAIWAFDLSRWRQVEVDARMAERSAAAI